MKMCCNQTLAQVEKIIDNQLRYCGPNTFAKKELLKVKEEIKKINSQGTKPNRTDVTDTSQDVFKEANASTKLDKTPDTNTQNLEGCENCKRKVITIDICYDCVKERDTKLRNQTLDEVLKIVDEFDNDECGWGSYHIDKRDLKEEIKKLQDTKHD